jgi:sphinganine-1-phosphate aldolase
MHLGEEGYLRLTAQVRAAAERFRRGIAAIDGVRVTGDPVPGVMEIASDTLDLAAVADLMDDRGWHLDRQQGGLHAIVSPSHLEAVDEFLADLAGAVVSAAAGSESRGVEARYGGGVA